MTRNLFSELIQDLNNLKDNIEVQNKKFGQNLKENSGECSQRAQQLSRYIDEQNKSIVDVLSKKYEKLKAIFTKLAE